MCKVFETRAGDAPFQANAMFAEIRIRPIFRPQPFQPGTPPLLTRHLQAQPVHRTLWVAPTLFRI